MNRTWAILTGEYPPSGGGVADHVRQVARGLAEAGDRVHVFTPPAPISPARDPGVAVHVLADAFGLTGISELDARLDELGDAAEILVQYTPQAFGMFSMNLPLCAFLAARRPLTVMFHEVMYPISSGQPLRYNLLGAVHRQMASLLVRAAGRVLVATPAWERVLREQCGASGNIEWCPIPSNLPTCVEAGPVTALRARLAREDELLIGHFGSYGAHTGDMLEPILVQILTTATNERSRAILIGRGGEAFATQLLTRYPALAGGVAASGALEPPAAAEHLAACDLLVQPYSDGVTFRRSSFMSALGLGMPIVTNLGMLSEDLWKDTAAVAVAGEPSPHTIARLAGELARDPARRREMRPRARRLYDEHFALEKTIQRLRKAPGASDRA